MENDRRHPTLKLLIDEFLKYFSRVPEELLAAHPRRRIDLRMQRRSGPYEPPKLKPFQVRNLAFRDVC